MADSDRAEAHGVVERLRNEPQRFDFFQALRLYECLHGDKPRLGKSLKVSDDPLRLGQNPDLDFPVATLSDCAPGPNGSDRLLVRFLGLFGPNGALPLHLTEYARDRLRHHGDPTFARFADVFHHRMLSLFYRAWANAQPTVSRDRPESDRFGFYLASLIGVAPGAFRDRDAMPDGAKLYFSGLLASQTKHADGLIAMLSEYFGRPVQVQEFVGEWMEIAVSDQSRLGTSPMLATLGQSVVVGAKTWGCQHKFRIVMGPLSLDAYRDMLPGGRALKELVALVRNYAGDELVWDVNLILRGEDIPPTVLDGSSQLGWTSWIGDRRGPIDAYDLMLNPFWSEQG